MPELPFLCYPSYPITDCGASSAEYTVCQKPSGQTGRNSCAFLVCLSCYKAALKGKKERKKEKEKGGEKKLLPKCFPYFERKVKTRPQEACKDSPVLVIYPFSHSQLAVFIWVLITYDI